jgi:hypothetical protein
MSITSAPPRRQRAVSAAGQRSTCRPTIDVPAFNFPAKGRTTSVWGVQRRHVTVNPGRSRPGARTNLWRPPVPTGEGPVRQRARDPRHDSGRPAVPGSPSRPERFGPHGQPTSTRPPSRATRTSPTNLTPAQVRCVRRPPGLKFNGGSAASALTLDTASTTPVRPPILTSVGDMMIGTARRTFNNGPAPAAASPAGQPVRLFDGKNRPVLGPHPNLRRSSPPLCSSPFVGGPGRPRDTNNILGLRTCLPGELRPAARSLGASLTPEQNNY